MNYRDLLGSIMTYGKPVSPKGEECKELMHVQLEVGAPLWEFEGVRELARLTKYMFREHAWYFGGDRDAAYISQYAKLWDEQKNDDNSLNSQYGILVFYQKQKHPTMGFQCMAPFEWAWKSLALDKDSRRAMIVYNSGAYNFLGNKDFICSTCQAFYIRGNKLLCYITLRSSDALLGVPYNSCFWRTVYQMMYLKLKNLYPELEQTDILVTIHSAHIYAKHFSLVEKMLAVKINLYDLVLKEEIPLGLNPEWYHDHIEEYFEIRRA